MVNIFQKKVLILAIYAGEIMMKNGAEVYRVEDTITRICKACRIDHVEIFATPTGIFVSGYCCCRRYGHHRPWTDGSKGLRGRFYCCQIGASCVPPVTDGTELDLTVGAFSIAPHCVRVQTNLRGICKDCTVRSTKSSSTGRVPENRWWTISSI